MKSVHNTACSIAIIEIKGKRKASFGSRKAEKQAVNDSFLFYCSAHSLLGIEGKKAAVQRNPSTSKAKKIDNIR